MNRGVSQPILAESANLAGNFKIHGIHILMGSTKRRVRTAYRARYVLLEPRLVLQDAVVYVSSSGLISRVESGLKHSANPKVEVLDWGSSIIMPGLVNAHAHLELTSLHDQLTGCTSFTDWISKLIGLRRLWTAEDFIASAREGARLSLASGTTLVGDITSSGVGWKATNGQNLRRVVFEEVLALSPEQANQALQQLNSLLDQAVPNSLQIHGISPHAPYSVSAELYRRAAEHAQIRGMLLATHVAETKAEVEFLKNGTGEFREFLETINALPTGWKAPGLSPVSYLEATRALGSSSLLIHCNYLDQESISRIQNARSSVVYCPRSHNFFGHEPHPVRQLLDSGINVALGTDSLASNSSLSMIDEMRFLFGKRKDLTAEEIFRAATMNGAAALNLTRKAGRLRRGHWADMTVLALPPTLGSTRLLDQILEGEGECIATIVQGQISWQKTTEQPPNYRVEEG